MVAQPAETSFLCDYPVELSDGELRDIPAVRDRWNANQVVPLTDQYVSNWLRLQAIAFDVGRQDEFEHVRIGTREFAAALARNGIKYTFEQYDGTHVSKVSGRMETKVLPFFSEILQFETTPRARIAVPKR